MCSSMTVWGTTVYAGGQLCADTVRTFPPQTKTKPIASSRFQFSRQTEQETGWNMFILLTFTKRFLWGNRKGLRESSDGLLRPLPEFSEQTEIGQNLVSRTNPDQLLKYK
jgi:hypothetical protein